jgi:hypothetical protein
MLSKLVPEHVAKAVYLNMLPRLVPEKMLPRLVPDHVAKAGT